MKFRSLDAPTCESDLGIDLAIIIDHTKSISVEHFETMKEALRKMVEGVNPISADTNRIALMTFAKEPDVINTFNDDTSYNKKELLDLVDGISAGDRGSRTRTDLALIAANETLFTAEGGDRPDNPNVLVLFTDGITHISSKPYEQIIPSLQVRNLNSIPPMFLRSKLSADKIERSPFSNNTNRTVECV